MAERMKVLTFHPPYATMVLLGLKAWETRGRPAPRTVVGRRVAIHQGTRPVSDGRIIGEWTTWRRSPVDWLAPRGEHEVTGNEIELPLGCILGTAVLARSIPVIESPHDVRQHRWDSIDHIVVDREAGSLTLVEFGDGTMRFQRIDRELPMGHYQEGRHVWAFTDPIVFDDPVPFRGGQGWSRSWEPTNG